MFELGFFELLMFAAIALIVLGPEKLPHAARVAGAWYGRIRRQITSIQQEIEKEVDALEAKQRLEAELKKINDMEAQIREQLKSAENAVNEYAGSTDAIRHTEFGEPYYFLISSTERERIYVPTPLLGNRFLP